MRPPLLLILLSICHLSQTIAGLPWVIGPCKSFLWVYFKPQWVKNISLTGCTDLCLKKTTFPRSQLAVWHHSHLCWCVPLTATEDVSKSTERFCETSRGSSVEPSRYSLVVLLRGPEMDRLSLSSSSPENNGEEVEFRATCVLQQTTDAKLELLRSLVSDAYWFLNGSLVHTDYKIPLQKVGNGEGNAIISAWRTALRFGKGDTIQVVFSTGSTPLSLTRDAESLVAPTSPGLKLKVLAHSEPSCLSADLTEHWTAHPRAFVGQDLTFEGRLELGEHPLHSFSYHWEMDDGTVVVVNSTETKSKIIHNFKTEGVHHVNLKISSQYLTWSTTLTIVVVHKISFTLLPKTPTTTSTTSSPSQLEVRALITDNARWEMELICSEQPTLKAPLTDQTACFPANYTFEWLFNAAGERACRVHIANGVLSFKSQRILFTVLPPKLQTAAITADVAVAATRESVCFTARVVPPEAVVLWRIIVWEVLDQKSGRVVVLVRDGGIRLVVALRDAGVYVVRVVISNQISAVEANETLTVQERIGGDVVLKPPNPILHVELGTELRFSANSSTEAKCSWTVRCNSSSTIHHPDHDECSYSHLFHQCGQCAVTLAIRNDVSAVQLPHDRWRVFVEESLTDLTVSAPGFTRAGSPFRIRVVVTPAITPVVVTVATAASSFLVEGSGVHEVNVTLSDGGGEWQWVRVRAHNNVSRIVRRLPVRVVLPVGSVALRSVGCRVVGQPARFLVLVNGEIPSGKESLLYHWKFLTKNGSATFFTSVPIAQSHTLTSPGELTVIISVRNEVSDEQSSLSVEISEKVSEPCLLHNATVEFNRPFTFGVLGLLPSFRHSDIELHLHISTIGNRQYYAKLNYTCNSTAINIKRWRYVFHSMGFRVIMVQVSSRNSDLVAANLTFRSGILVQRRLESVVLRGPDTIPAASRVPLVQEWRAIVNPSSYGCVFIWSLRNNEETVSARSTFVLFDIIPPGNYTLQLRVLNAFGELKTSMQVQAALALIILNFSLTDFFVGRNGTLSVTINQPSPPSRITVDFGDSTVIDSTTHPEKFWFERLANHSTFNVHHAYRNAGIHIIYFNASNSISRIERSVPVLVHVPMAGVVVELLSPSVVALFEEVLVQCVVEVGSNLNFEWDFGDGTDGQYTVVNSTKNKSLANHSYGVADTYNISVVVFNDLQSVVVHLNSSIQAVEPIEKLHLRTRSEQYAAPLLLRKPDSLNNSCLYSTDMVVFEAWVWRGSDVQFHFDFGDGTIQMVESTLNVWSLPWATIKHAYCAVGEYVVSVIATNPLDSVNITLQPFYVEVAPEGLTLDKQYYIVQYSNNVTLQATISKGTNVYFKWMLNNEQLTETGKTLTLPNLRPGIYIVSVEVFNKVTDFAFKSIQRPKALAKLFVQEKLNDISLCLDLSDEEVCDEQVIELPYDEELKFVAKVFPPAEMSLRFTWQLGPTEVKRTTRPILIHKFKNPGRFNVNVTAQNHISSTLSSVLSLHLVQRIANLTSIHCQGPNLVNHNITFRALYWFGTNLTFQWDFGDGSPLLNTHSSFVQHIYKEVGEYWVSVNVWNKYSHANLTTNMFFLNHVCQKPEINFLNNKESSSRYDKDILIEAEINTNCEKNSIKYTWNVESTENSNSIYFEPADILQQRYLMIPRYTIKPGTYRIHLHVEMSNYIVYAKSTTLLTVKYPDPVAYIKGGYLRWIGFNDTVDITAELLNFRNSSQMSYIWSCVPHYQKHFFCFHGTHPPAFISTDINAFHLAASSFTPGLTSVVINVTVGAEIQTSALQVIEIKDAPHVLLIDVECDGCEDHHINQDFKIKLKAVCHNCQSGNIEYNWIVWKIHEGKLRMHFTNYECVQADGSTFYIVAPNTTFLPNLTDIQNELPPDSMTSPHSLSDQLIGDDIPPFPNLPGFPEETNFPRALKLVRSIRDSNQHLDEEPDYEPDQHYPFEEEAHYDTDNSLFNLSYPDFLPFSPFDPVLGNPDYPLPEEGHPGESGSAVARDQSSQTFKDHLSEDSVIEEGVGNSRIDGEITFIHNNDPFGDPVRDGNFDHQPTMKSFLNRPRKMVSLARENTTTGFNSVHFILKPGVLQMGNTYLIEVAVRDRDSGMDGYAMEFFEVNVGPVNGRCTLMPVKGFSMNFNFGMHCLEWRSEHQPLYYELRYSLKPNGPGHVVYYGLNSNVKFVLPAGDAAHSFNVFLNVIIRNNLGAATKVCSLIREVMPTPLNVTLMQYVYNETFHPQSQLAQYLGEKQNQALLHQIHILTVSVNSHASTKGLSLKEKSLMEQIRFKFLEIIENLKMLHSVEVVQSLSCINEILTDAPEITMFELQKIYNIYQRFHAMKSQLYGYNQAVLQNEFLVLLSKLIYAVHSVYMRNEELIRIGRELFITEIKEKFKSCLMFEEPLTVEVPHTFTRAAYLLNEMENWNSNPFDLPLKTAAVQIQANDFEEIAARMKKRTKKCSESTCSPSTNCLALIAQEFDYVSIPHYLNFAQLLPSQKSSVLLTFLSCEKFDVLSGINMNFSVKFSRNAHYDVLNKIPLSSSYINVHQINITDDDIYHSLFFHLKFGKMNLSVSSYTVEALLSYENWPTLRKYTWKSRFPSSSKDHSFFIPEYYFKVPGVYYFSLWIPLKDKAAVSVDLIGEYNIMIWKDVCLGKSQGMWSTHICSSINSTNLNWIDCRCSAQEMTAYATSLNSSILLIPSSAMKKPYFNVLLLLLSIMCVLVYSVLFFLNLQKDRIRNLSMSPIPMRDNNEKHKQLYLICVKTGMYYSAGTTASVFVVLHGTRGMTETRQLIDSRAKKFSFQKGAVDYFLMSTEVNLGPLIKLEVWHNNFGISPAWYLKNISVTDLRTGSNYQFKCNKWLSAEREDRQIERELLVADSTPSFARVFLDNFITCIHDLNMWNAMVCGAPTSFFTGIQRLTCCFCFCFNCALLSSLLQEQFLLKEEHGIQHISPLHLSLCILTSAIATLPQLILTILFRYTKLPSLKLNPVLSQLCCSLSTHHLYCWLRQKRSNSSRSSQGSDSSLEGSDSLYSSYEESSAMSIPEMEEENLTTEDKEEFPSTLSLDNDLVDPVSPLQKTLSTWQAFENWVRKKQDNITKPEIVSRRQQKSDSALISEEIMLEEIDCNDEDGLSDSNEIQPISPTISAENLVLDPTEEDVDDSKVMDHLNSNLQLPYLHSALYYVAWSLLFTNIIISIVITSIKVSGFSVLKCSLWMKLIFIEILFSIFIITPILITLFTFVSSLKSYMKSMPRSAVFYDQSLKGVNRNEADNPKSIYNRIEYLKRYLRPPRENALEEFRKTTLKNKYLLYVQSNFWKYVFTLILLLILTLPEDTQNKYLQRVSILNAFFRSKGMPNLQRPFKSTTELCNWLEYDFPDELYGKDQCLDHDQECGVIVSTGCIVIGSGILRTFSMPMCNHFTTLNCHNSHLDRGPKHLNSDHQGYEPRHLQGQLGIYFKDDHIKVLGEDKYETQEKIYNLVPYILNYTTGAISLEFLLFNPSLSTFVALSFLFEVTNSGILLSKEVVLAKFPETSSLPYHANFSFHLLFLLIILVKCKNQCWCMLKYGRPFLKNGWNQFLMLFNLVSLSYVVVYMMYSINLRKVFNDFEEAQVIFHSDVIELAYFETLAGYMLTYLIFLHLIGSLQILNFIFRLKKQMRKLLNSARIILGIFLVHFLISICYFMLTYYLEDYSNPSHPFVFLLKCMSVILKDFHKPEITSKHHSLITLISAVIMFVVVVLHVVLLSFIRAILINTKSSVHPTREKVTLKDAGKVLKKQMYECLKPKKVPQIVESHEHMPPVEFMLMELEQLADRLVSKADILFGDQEICEEIMLESKLSSSNVEGYLKSQCQLLERGELDFSAVEPKVTPDEILKWNLPTNLNCMEEIKAEINECLNATMPRHSKPCHKSFMPSSLNASLASQRKFKYQAAGINLSASLQSNKIRKTYPLSQIDVDSSESLSEDEDAVNNIFVRKTKSRGKGKLLDLNLTVLDDSLSSQ